jgi:hypothetical protein
LYLIVFAQQRIAPDVLTGEEVALLDAVEAL